MKNIRARALKAAPQALLSAVLAAIPLGSALAAQPSAAGTAHKHAKAQHGSKSAKAPEAATPAYGQREEVLRFAAELAERRGIPRGWIEAQLAQARLQPGVQRAIMPPPAGSAKNWAAYRARFVEPQRIEAGLAFWRANRADLQRAEALYGVPAEIVVGIVGVETFYGRMTGNYRAIDALATLAFDFPPGRKDRSAYFRSELEALLARAWREGSDPSAIKGSFAGAIGLPQFMPGSIERYAVDFDGDGRIDLLGSTADAIGSVAHYLAEFGWQRGQATHFAVAAPVDAADRAVLLVPDILPSFSPAQLAERGAALSPEGQRHDGLLALVELQNGERAPSYIAGTQNFYAITRYNWSSYYALAVIELGQAVRQRVLAATP
jgi:membrane-bound lytic murein transglycosylase B